MSTRAEQVEACESVVRSIEWEIGSDRNYDTPDARCRPLIARRDAIKSAAATLTRDGELRERLAAYADELEASGDPEEAAAKRAIGAALKALLKETSDALP